MDLSPVDPSRRYELAFKVNPILERILNHIFSSDKPSPWKPYLMWLTLPLWFRARDPFSDLK
jgi:hypothetical protein